MTQKRRGRHSHRRRPHRWVVLLVAWIGSWPGPVFSQAGSLRLEQVELSDTGHRKLVSLQFSQPPAALKAFALGSPPRVVIDVQGPIRPVASARYAARDSLIQRVRVGFHQEYIRFVLDLRKSFIPPFSVEQTQERVIASLQVPGQEATAAPAQVLFARRGTTRKTPAGTGLSQTGPPAVQAAPEEATRDHSERFQVTSQTGPPAVQAAQTPEPPPPAPATIAAKINAGSSDTAAQTPEPPPPAPAPRLVLPEARQPVQVRASRSAGDAPVPRLVPGASLLRPSPAPQAPRQAYSLLNPVTVPSGSAAASRQPSVAPAPSRSPSQPPGAPAPSRQLAALSPNDALSQPARKAPSGSSLSSSARRHLGKGQILYDQGKVDEAVVEWRETARLAPNNAKAHHLLGLALQDQGKTGEAISTLQTSVRLDPGNATAYVHLAQALESKGDRKGALDAYNKARKLVPTSAHVHNRLGHLLASTGDWQGAAREWRQTTELQPDYAYAYANLGEALEKIEQNNEALDAYKQAVILDPAAPFAAEVRKRIVRLSTDEP